jgi:hypothetical protein
MSGRALRANVASVRLECWFLVASSSGFLPPRYFLFAVSPVMISSAWCIDQIFDWISRGVRWLMQRSSAQCRLTVSLLGSIIFTSLAIGACAAPLRLDYYAQPIHQGPTAGHRPG